MKHNLKKLTEDLTEEQIYIYEKQAGYLQELFLKHPALFSKIVAVIEPNSRYQGEVCGIKTVGVDKLNEIDWKKSALIITSDYYEEAYGKLLSYKALLPETIYYFLNYESELELEYRGKYEKQDLENQILFRSGPHQSQYVAGMDFADNSRALFEYMLQAGYNERYKLIWMVKNPADFSNYSEIKNVSFISWDWEHSDDEAERKAYFDALYLSKYIFFTDAYGFARNCRQDQVRVQLWHGCGYKTRTNFVPCEHRYEYNIVVGPEYKRIHADIYGLRADQVLVTGYPKEDLLFHPIEKNKLGDLGIPKVKKYIFWLPTFRTAKNQLSELNENGFNNQTGLPIVETQNQLENIDRILEAGDATLVVKLHPFQKKELIKLGNCKRIILLENETLTKEDLQINSVLGLADALISDYSSTVIDYLILNRPIAMTMDDAWRYEQSRGFVFDNIHDWVPGAEIYKFEELLSFIQSVIDENDYTKTVRENVRAKVHAFSDDGSCKRVLDVLKINCLKQYTRK